MSDIVEKTLTALPGLFLQTPGAAGPAAARAPFSSRLGGLIRGITALTSKHVSAGRAEPEIGAPGRPRAGRPVSAGSPGLALRGARAACVGASLRPCGRGTLRRD